MHRIFSTADNTRNSIATCSRNIHVIIVITYELVILIFNQYFKNSKLSEVGFLIFKIFGGGLVTDGKMVKAKDIVLQEV